MIFFLNKGNEVLRLLPYYYDLNPIGLICGFIRGVLVKLNGLIHVIMIKTLLNQPTGHI
jgi:hypothetical protein